MIYQFSALGALFTYFIVVPEFLKQFWPSSIQNELLFHVVFLQLVHVVFYCICNGYYFLIYNLNMPYFEQFKVEKNKWPWEQDIVAWQQIRFRTLTTFVVNIIIGTALTYVASYRGVKQRMDLESIPTYYELGWQMLFCILMEDLCFYWTHRILHHPKLYRFHKQHHSYNITVSICAEYAHPVEYIIGNIFPFIIGPTILNDKMHLLSLWVWMAFRIIKTHSAHSGYQFPWEPFQYIPMSTQTEFHSYHHSHNKGNYGSMLRMWDYIFATSESYYTSKEFENYGIIKKKLI